MNLDANSRNHKTVSYFVAPFGRLTRSCQLLSVLRGGRLAVMVTAVALTACGNNTDAQADLVGRFAYPAALPASCPDGARQEAVAVSREKVGKLSYLVRTPSNYDARFAHPLLVVYAAAGASAEQTERYTNLTSTATSNGLVVAYVDHRPMGLKNVIELGGVARSVASRWCIDQQRVFLTGHSDGGTVSSALALLEATRSGVSGIAASAAGFSKQDLQQMSCRSPIPVMVMHGAKDTHFPGWGREAAQWWATCNGCQAPTVAADASGCVSYTHCKAPVMYCEGQHTHREWSGLEAKIITFLLAHGTQAQPRPESQVDLRPSASAKPSISEQPAHETTALSALRNAACGLHVSNLGILV